MEKTNKCLKEWNAVIEALGQGKQTILIRKYKTSLDKFLLYPTVHYTRKGNYLDSFKKACIPFVEDNSIPSKEGDKTEIKYIATVEGVIEKPVQKIRGLQKYFIWTTEHVKSYLNNRNANVWLLRVYTLPKPYMAEPTPGPIRYANLKEEVSLRGIKPVLDDNEFSKIAKQILK